MNQADITFISVGTIGAYLALRFWLARRRAAAEARRAKREADMWAKFLVDTPPRDVLDRLYDCINDPMWADHAEVSKSLLQEAARELEQLRAERRLRHV